MLGLEFQRARYVQAVEHTYAELGTVTPGQLGTEFKGTFRDGDVTPEACLMIRLEFPFDSARVGCGDLPAKDLLTNRMGPFRYME